jgi:hypothetical protein
MADDLYDAQSLHVCNAQAIFKVEESGGTVEVEGTKHGACVRRVLGPGSYNRQHLTPVRAQPVAHPGGREMAPRAARDAGSED